MEKAILFDRLNLFRKLTFRRFLNGLTIYCSYHISRFLKKPLLKGMPISISFEPTTACNLGCPECPSGLKQFSRPTGNLNSDFYKSTIDQLAPTLNYLTFYFQGEPYIHPKFLEMVRYAADKKIYTATSTNAHFMSREKAEETVRSGLDRLIISIDGTTQEVYENYRIHGKLDKVIEGTKNILEAKERLNSKTPHIIFQFLVVAPNEHQINDVFQLGEKLGVDEVRLKTAQVYDFKNGNDLIPNNAKYSRYRKQKDGTYVIKNKLLNQCWKMWSSCVITWDGKIVPCCFDKDATHQLGELNKDRFKNIWKGKDYKRFRSGVLKSRSTIDICNNCTEGTKVWEEK